MWDPEEGRARVSMNELGEGRLKLGGTRRAPGHGGDEYLSTWMGPLFVGRVMFTGGNTCRCSWLKEGSLREREREALPGWWLAEVSVDPAFFLSLKES